MIFPADRWGSWGLVRLRELSILCSSEVAELRFEATRFDSRAQILTLCPRLLSLHNGTPHVQQGRGPGQVGRGLDSAPLGGDWELGWTGWCCCQGWQHRLGGLLGDQADGRSGLQTSMEVSGAPCDPCSHGAPGIATWDWRRNYFSVGILLKNWKFPIT